MTTTTNEANVVSGQNERIDLVEKRGLLSALWLVVLLNLLFRDVHEIVKVEFLTDAMNGIYNGREVTEAMFLLGGLIVEVPIAMMLMSLLLPIRANRVANLIAASLFGLAVITTVPGDLDDYFHSAVELAALAAIAWQAWKWKRS